MNKKYQVSVSDYSLNELTEKLVRYIFGDKVKAGADSVIPFFSELVQSNPSEKGVTWELEYKSQADKLASELNTLLKGAARV